MLLNSTERLTKILARIYQKLTHSIKTSMRKKNSKFIWWKPKVPEISPNRKPRILWKISSIKTSSILNKIHHIIIKRKTQDFQILYRTQARTKYFKGKLHNRAITQNRTILRVTKVPVPLMKQIAKSEAQQLQAF